MPDDPGRKRYFVDMEGLPARYPTHRHTAEFWENLGRTIATFGFLENTLARAIFSFTSKKGVAENRSEHGFKNWAQTLEHALFDPFGGLITSYADAVRADKNSNVVNIEKLIEDLRAVSIIRNVLCHSSWNTPDDQGRSIPFFVDRRMNVFDEPIDVAYLHQLQRHVAELALDVINTVTQSGWQFPGTNGPGDWVFFS